MLKATGFRNSLDLISHDEMSIRESLTRNRLSFGIQYLDDAMKGIISTDLIIIAAGTGLGKTELASNIAYKNADDGKRVYGIFLEAFRGEIELRQKYRKLALEAKKEGLNPDYSEWIMGDQPWLDQFSHRVDYSPFQNVYTKYRDQNYTIDNLQKDLLAINEDADLIVIDHLHYFDIEDENENRGMTKIVKTISDIIQVIQRPVVLVSHLRKRNDYFSSPLPEISDLHGSSNISKIATKVVVMGKGGSNPTHTYTYMKAAKFRLNSSAANFVAVCKYNHELNDYEKNYKLGSLNFNKSRGQWDFDEAKLESLPRWYRKLDHANKS